MNYAPCVLLVRRARALLVALSLLAVFTVAPTAGAQVAPMPSSPGAASAPIGGQGPVTGATVGQPPPTRVSGGSGALTPFKAVSVPAATVSDVAISSTGDILVASGSSVFTYLPPGLYAGKVDIGSTITSIVAAGSSVFVSRNGGTERRNASDFAVAATYPGVGGLSDQPVSGDWLLYVAGASFGRLSLSTGATQTYAPPSGTPVAIYAVPGTTSALAVTTAPDQVVQFDVSPAAPATPAVTGSSALLDGATAVELLGPAGNDAAALVTVAGVPRRVALPITGVTGTDLGGALGGVNRATSTSGNGGWDLVVAASGAGSGLELFTASSTTPSGATNLPGRVAAETWNAQGTQFVTVSPAASGSATSTLRLFTPPGEPRPATAFAGADGEYTGITPTRVLDTRRGLGAPGPVGPTGTVQVQVTGQGPIPADRVLAVAVNVTLIGPSTATYLAAYPTGGSTPFVSTVNANAGETRTNLAIVRVGTGGAISIVNAAGSAHVVADVQGYFSSAPGVAGGRYHALTPARLLDTRAGAAIGADGLTGLAVRGHGGVPAGATAVAVTLTAVAPTTETFLTVFPSDAARPFASNLNPRARETVANLVFTRIGTDGNIALYNALGASDVLVDVVGFWDTARTTEAGRYVPFSEPFRYYDSRDGDGPLPSQWLRSLHVAGWPTADPVMPLPDDGAGAVVFNLTATNTTAGGFLTAYPGPINTPPPLASNVNFAAGQTAATLAVTGYGSDGQVSFYNPAGTTDVIVDVAGFFTSAAF